MDRVAVFIRAACKMYLENWKSFQQLIPDKMTTDAVTGLNCGIMMQKKVANGLHPSIAAA